MGKILNALIVAFLFFATVTKVAGEPASLVADQITLPGDGRIIASGNVEILLGEQHVTATSVIYNETDGSLKIGGPLRLRTGTGDIILADAAALSDEMREGILEGARLLMSGQLQIGAEEIRLRNGRFTHLRDTVATTCRVCAARPIPLWQIRADDIVHDAQTKRLYFNNARFEILGVPVFYTPKLRIPDPSVARASGFLVPSIKSSSLLGSVVEIPYFIAMGDHADLTVTPGISETTTTVQLRYRQAFRHGRINVDSNISNDTINNLGIRGYLFSDGKFKLPNDYKLNYEVQLSSDQSYLTDYGISEQDRLESNVTVVRTRQDENFSAAFYRYRTLRGSEFAIDEELPNIQAEFRYERLFYPTDIDGQLSWKVYADAHHRASSQDVAGRDQMFAGTALNWRSGRIFGPGIILETEAGARAGAYQFADDNALQGGAGTLRASTAATFRWPLMSRRSDGSTTTLEPILQIGWADEIATEIPNEDSTLVEIDPGNLLNISRFPGEDRYETGLRATAAVKWGYNGADGTAINATIARIFRLGEPVDLSTASGLSGKISDWLVSGTLNFNRKFSMDSHIIISDESKLRKFESRIHYDAKRFDMGAAVSWMVADPAENRNFETAQLSLDGGFDINKNWSGTYDFRVDFQALTPTIAKLGLEYSTDCAIFDLSLSRRFTSSGNIQPNTDWGLSVSIPGFGNKTRQNSSVCSR